MKRLALRGAAWTIIGYGFGQGLRLISNIILAKLLVPDVFGLMALVNTFIIGLVLFSDVGIRPSIIHNSRGEEPGFYNTAWTIQAIRGILLWIACLIITIPVADFYQEPQLRWLLPLVGFTCVISGFESTSVFILGRRMSLGKLTIFEIISQSVGLVVIIVWAIITPNIWALVAGNLVSALFKTIASHFLLSEVRNRFYWEKSAFNEVVSFGRWIFASTMMHFLAMQSDRLILGKLISLQSLGIYNIAYTFADLPRVVMEKIGNDIIFPVISRMTHQPRPLLREKIVAKRRLILALAIPLLAVFVSFGDLLIVLLYDQRYQEGTWMLPIIAFGVWPNLLIVTIGPALYSFGKPLYSGLGNFLKFLYMLIFIPWGFHVMGTIGAVIVVAFNDLPYYIIVGYGLWREGLQVFLQDLLGTLSLVVLIVLLVTLRHFLGWGWPLQSIIAFSSQLSAGAQLVTLLSESCR